MTAIEIGIEGKHELSGNTEKRNQVVKAGVRLTPKTKQYLVLVKQVLGESYQKQRLKCSLGSLTLTMPLRAWVVPWERDLHTSAAGCSQEGAGTPTNGITMGIGRLSRLWNALLVRRASW